MNPLPEAPLPPAVVLVLEGLWTGAAGPLPLVVLVVLVLLPAMAPLLVPEAVAVAAVAEATVGKREAASVVASARAAALLLLALPFLVGDRIAAWDAPSSAFLAAGR